VFVAGAPSKPLRELPDLRPHIAGEKEGRKRSRGMGKRGMEWEG